MTPSSLNTSPEDEFTPLVEEFQAMKRRLDEVENAKTQFFSHAAHELKGPLATMQESIHLLLDPAQGPLTPQQKRLLEIQLNSSKRLFTMLSNLADLSRLEAGALEYCWSNHDVSALIEQWVTEIQSRLKGRELSLQTDIQEGALQIRADEARLRQAICQLFDNALKFSPPLSPIRMSTQYSAEFPDTVPADAREHNPLKRRDEGFILVKVADRGTGIPTAERQKIFHKFYQVKDRNQISSSKGLGIGLTLSRLIAEAHQGSLWVEDNPEGGSIFVLLLPANHG